jgi:hypothetical protein
MPVVTRDQVRYVKPDPDLFLAAAARLTAPIETAGDVIWYMCRGVGLLSGGYGQKEPERAGSGTVYEDPGDLLRHLDEVGGRRQIPPRRDGRVTISPSSHACTLDG